MVEVLGRTQTTDFVGSSVLRVEDIPLLTGGGEYVGDVNRPGQVWARFVRSEVANGRIVSIDLDEARSAPGVVGIFTAAELPDVRIPLRIQWGATDETRSALQPPLARGRVRYVGEPVVVVVATSQYAAEDAAELVFVEIEEFPALVDTVRSAEETENVLHTEVGSNVVNRIQFADGDVEPAFAEAAVIIRERMHMHRHTGVPLEMRGLVAEHDRATGRLTVWGPTKVKHFNRAALASLLGWEEERIRYLEPDVGGGFGVRGEFYPEDFVVPWIAVTLGRPVKWLEDRREHFLTTNHSRERTHEIEIAVAADGTFIGLRDRNWVDLGAYVRTHGLALLISTLLHIAGPYRWQVLAVDSSGVMTNKTPVGTYRGPGQVEVSFVREGMIDRAAQELRIDPAELRRRNLVTPGELPVRTDLGGGLIRVIEDGNFPDAWERFLVAADYAQLRTERDAARARGELVGIGLAAVTEHGGVGPYEQARVVPEADGGFAVHVGLAAVGQGVRTALGQVAADQLRVPLERVRVTHHDTDVIPQGFGAFSSRGTIFGSSAIILAVRDLHDRAAAAAAERFGVAASDVVIEGALAEVDGQRVPLEELGCVGEGRFSRSQDDTAFHATLAFVALDRETGKVDILRYVVGFDVGRAVNPQLVVGQLVGGAAQGIAGALLEELSFDDGGQPQCTTFVDYLMPTASDLPHIDTIVFEYPAMGAPLGVRGAGEGGIGGSAGAIANAVADAVGDSRAICSLPLRPEFVKQLIDRAPNTTSPSSPE